MTLFSLFFDSRLDSAKCCDITQIRDDDTPGPVFSTRKAAESDCVSEHDNDAIDSDCIPDPDVDATDSGCNFGHRDDAIDSICVSELEYNATDSNCASEREDDVGN